MNKKLFAIISFGLILSISLFLESNEINEIDMNNQSITNVSCLEFVQNETYWHMEGNESGIAIIYGRCSI